MISVVIPVYNIAPYIEKCLHSVLRQTFSDYEVICVNDGSTDESGEICERVAKKYAAIRVLHQENKGLSAARNKGIEEAKGDYIAFVDGDDIVHPEYLENLSVLLEKYDAQIAVCAYERLGTQDWHWEEVKETTATVSVYTKEEAIAHREQMHQMAWNKLYKRTLFEKERFTEGILHEDVDSYYRFIMKAEKIVYTDRNLYGYVQRNSSIMGIQSEKSYRDWEEALLREVSYFREASWPAGIYYAFEELAEFYAMYYMLEKRERKDIRKAREIHERFRRQREANRDIKCPLRYRIFHSTPVVFLLFMKVREPRWYDNVVLQKG